MKRFKRVCFLDTLYSLLIYLLLCNDRKTIDETFFFFTDRVDKSIRDRFDNKYVFKFKTSGGVRRWLYDVYYKLVIVFRFGFVKKSEIYGNDCHRYSFLFMGYGDFNVVEDGIINNYMGISLNKGREKNRTTFFDNIRFLLFGGPFLKWGMDEKVVKIYLTGFADIPNEIRAKVELVNMQELFDGFSDKSYLNSIFGVDAEDITLIKSRKTVLFTQCFDNLILDSEKMDLYGKILSKYDKNDILIKAHPRELTDYRSFFPGYVVVDKPMPIEILKLNGIDFDKAITLCSLAAMSYKSVDWYGSNVTETFKNFYNGNEVRKPNVFL